VILRVLLLWLVPALCIAQTVNVGSKRFTESYILGEILARAIDTGGAARAIHHRGLGNTSIVFAALKSGSIDLYAEYTGTIAFELLGLTEDAEVGRLDAALAPHGIAVAIPLGFNNSYALGMRADRAAELAISRISDLARHPGLRLGLSQEFLNRSDGWPALSRAYGLPHAPRGLDHGLAYEALAAGRVDVIDAYTTDAKIRRYDVRLLDDDLGFFPRYDAVILYRRDFPQRYPEAWSALVRLEGAISAPRMAAMNAEAELAGRPFESIARAFFEGEVVGGAAVPPHRGHGFWRALWAPDFGRLTLEHLVLLVASLVPAAAVGVPLGVAAAYSRRAGRWILAFVGLMQTVPALALLAFLISAMGMIGAVPAVIALFLYALLPIVRNTASGLADLPLPLREAARALGLPAFARLRSIELPLASRSIFAGIKTSAVICVGTATIAAFIGAGGYGERIVAGLAVNDSAMLLAGAVPAAALALAVQWGFDLLERRLIPAGLQLGLEAPPPG
jgi:osmoprotectant transport system permease protein